MFFHNYKYNCLLLLRNKVQLFWILAFPILLGTLFFFAFGSLFETTEKISAIPVAIVADESTQSDIFGELVTELSQGESPMISAEYTDNDTALEMLKSGDADAIIYSTEDDITMTVKTTGINQTIVKSIVDTYRTNAAIVTETALSNPQNVAAVVEAMSQELNVNREINLSTGNMDLYVQYFYNLIAMVCLLTCDTGLEIVTKNQANLSSIGSRKCVSPISNLTKVLSGFAATVTINYVMLLVVFVYLACILGINFGVSMPQMLLASFVGVILGTSIGFCIGSIGNMKQGTKSAILTGFSLFCCTLSGLMGDAVSKAIKLHCPIVNQLNPAAILTDCYYALNVYDTFERFNFNLLKMAIYSLVFLVVGCIFMRRKKYASI